MNEDKPTREVITDSDGREVIRATCSKGHVWIAPNKGLGRANTAAWESRHQHVEDAS